MDNIYVNGMVPLGKLRILPKKRKVGELVPPADGPIITDPYGIIHTQHVKYDASTRVYSGLPSEWEAHLKQQFGLPPQQIERIKVPGYKARIPTVLVQMKDYLVKNGGLLVEGIFRLAPDMEESTMVKKALNENKFVRCDDINCISNLIKVWFRDLPNHILNELPADQISECDDEDKVGRLILQLKEPLQSIFLWLTDLCLDVSEHQSVNKMTPQNLAIVFGPNLFTPRAVDPMASLVFSQKVASFVHLCVHYRRKTRQEHQAQFLNLHSPMSLDVHSAPAKSRAAGAPVPERSVLSESDS